MATVAPAAASVPVSQIPILPGYHKGQWRVVQMQIR